MAAVIAPIITVEGRKFLETTTIRGVQRIVKSKSRVLFIFWLLAVLLAAALLIWQISMVFIRYFKYPVNTLYVQSADWQSTTFPDITICNLCPFVNEDQMNLSYTDYVKAFATTFTIEEVQSYVDDNYYGYNVTEDDYNILAGDFLSASGYFRNFPIFSGIAFDDQTTPVIDCGYFNWDYSPIVNYNCTTKIKTIWDPEYYKCYTSSLIKKERKNVRGFSAVLYMDDFYSNQIVDFELDLRNPRATGMQVMIHEPGTIPDMKLGISVNPGQRTTIALDQTIRTQQPAPYSNCTTQPTFGSSNIKYTQEYCVDVCVQAQYLKNCSCLLNTLQYTDQQLSDANYTMCGNLSITDTGKPLNWKGFDQYLCALYLEEDHNRCVATCFTPCEQYRYDTRISAASWPHISAQASFYSSYIQNNPRFGTYYDDYQIVLENAITNESASRELLLKLSNEGLIQENFLQLNIMFNSRSYHEQKDVVSITAEALGAQIGGVLSLWLGITIMVVFELCEFLVTFLVNSYYARKANSSTVA